MIGTMPPVQLFYLLRTEDKVGVSGTGLVAVGVIFPTGWCALCWLTRYSSVAIYPDIYTVKQIHGHGGSTKVVVAPVTVSDETEI